MKKILIYIAALAAALMVPAKGTDVGKLQPVGVVQLYKEADTIIIATDTGDAGRGKTVEEAFENLEETTAGIIFLDTADYLLLSETAAEELESLEGYLKSSVRLCLAEKEIDPAQAAEYLAVHRPATRLKDREDFLNAGKLEIENGRLILK